MEADITEIQPFKAPGPDGLYPVLLQQGLREGETEGDNDPGPMDFRGPMVFRGPMGLKRPMRGPNGLHRAHRNETSKTFFFGDHLKLDRKTVSILVKTFFFFEIA